MSAPEYPISTLVEMAAIPEEALPRFLADLPAIIVETRRVLAIQDVLRTIAGEGATVEFDGMSWVDDNLGQVTRSVSLGDEEIASFTTGLAA